jgi:arsenate reductase
VANVLFLCIGNAGRSQMAHAFLERLGGHEVRSAGSRAESRLHPEVVEAMRPDAAAA